jgi:hypothetical protein
MAPGAEKPSGSTGTMSVAGKVLFSGGRSGDGFPFSFPECALEGGNVDAPCATAQSATLIVKTASTSARAYSQFPVPLDRVAA